MNAARFGVQASGANIVLRGADQGELSAYLGRMSSLPGMQSMQPIDPTNVGGEPLTLLQATWGRRLAGRVGVGLSCSAAPNLGGGISER